MFIYKKGLEIKYINFVKKWAIKKKSLRQLNSVCVCVGGGCMICDLFNFVKVFYQGNVVTSCCQAENKAS